MMSKQSLLLLAAFALCAGGCTDDAHLGVQPPTLEVVPDGGMMDSGMVDSMSDGGMADATTETPCEAIAPTICDGDCGEGQLCVHGACIARCGTMLDADANDLAKTWNEGLAANIKPIANLCGQTSNFGAFGELACQGDSTVFQASIENGETSFYSLNSWKIDTRVSAPSISEIAQHELSIDEGLRVYASSYVTPNTDGSRVAFGYTTSAASVNGEIFIDTVEGESTSIKVGANGNYDLHWVDSQTFLVAAQSLGETLEGGGIYRGVIAEDGSIETTKLIENIGLNNGSIAFSAEADAFLMGGYGFDDDGDAGEENGEQNRVFVIPANDVLTATKIIDVANGDYQFLAVPSSFELLAGNTFVAFDAAWTDHEMRDVSIDEKGDVVFSSVAPFMSGDSFFAATNVVGSELVLIAHGDGFLLASIEE